LGGAKNEFGGFMIIRTKSGELQTGNISVLLDFLGVKKEAVGLYKVDKEIELMASVPFRLTADVGAKNSHPCEFLACSFCEAKTTPKALDTAASMPPKAEGFLWTLSTNDLDRYGERIDPQGWDFTQYLKNPIVEWAYNFMIPAIGKIEGLAVDGDGLHGLVYFNDKAYDPFGWGIGQRVKAGVIRAGSVGFKPIEIEIPSKEDSKDGTSLIFRKQELLEFSICNVPANPFALANSKEQISNNKEEGVNAAFHWGGLINNF
jgi:uncharacterized protein